MGYSKLIGFWLALLLFCTRFTYAQTDTDSLRKLLSVSQPDTVRLQLLNTLAYALRRSKSEEALAFASEAVSLSERLQRLNDLAIAQRNLGLAHHYLAESSKAIEYYLKALTLSQKLQNASLEATLLLNIGNVYLKLYNYDRAREYYQKSLAVAETIKEPLQKAKALGSLGNLSDTPEEAIDYFSQAYSVFEEINDYRNMAITLSNIGKVNVEAQNYRQALAVYYQALRFDSLQNDRYGMSISYSNLGNVHRKLNSFDSALFYYKKVENIANQLSSLRRKEVIYGKLSLLYKQMGNYKMALAYHEKYYAATDSLNKTDLEKEISEIQAKYDLESHQNEIELLKSKDELNQIQLAKQQSERITLLFLVLFFAAGAVVLWLRFTEKRKLTHERHWH